MFFRRRKQADRPLQPSVSSDYRVIESAPSADQDLNGWFDAGVAERQDEAWKRLISEMYEGHPRIDLRAAADAIRATGLADPLILEVGCGSGYYFEILSNLLKHRLRYTGLDSSLPMVALAKLKYHEANFVRGDAAALPFSNGSFDIAFNGVSLMHTVRYEKAIAESRRVSRTWCILHTVPVLEHRPTTKLMKDAYGMRVLEIIFNESELKAILARNQLEIIYETESIPYNLEAVLSEKTMTKTYICRIRE